MSNRFARFTRVNRPDAAGQWVIKPTSIFILPTAFGMVYFLLLLLLLIGSINYANNQAFLLTFFLASVGFLGMIHTWRNLVGLSLSPAKVHPVFAGNPAIFPFNIFARGNRFRGDIELHHPAAPLSAADIPAGKEVVLDLQIPSRRRGYLVPGRWRIETRYPLGIFRAWCYLEGDHRCTVFPRAEPWNLETLQGSESDHSHGMPKKAVSGQDFHGIREYRPGDPMKSIHWPSLARGMEMMSREYETQANNDLWLDLEQMPGTNLELRLSQLCHASMVCSEQGRTFGVRLGNQRIGPDQGDAYLLRVLHALATFGL